MLDIPFHDPPDVSTRSADQRTAYRDVVRRHVQRHHRRGIGKRVLLEFKNYVIEENDRAIRELVRR